MCGIAGIVSADPSGISLDRLKAMTDSIAHRGPDGEGFWIDPAGGIGFGHRRLSVIDLSDAARQPMQDEQGRYTLIFNGEIYNYIELKARLQDRGYRFHSSSDTEVLLAMYDWKKEACLVDLDGMFAFAIHDKVGNRLFCARDRFGEKPFYYAFKPGSYFVFGSEMKALWAAGVPKEVDHSMLYNYLAFGLVDNPNDKTKTFYEGISSLPNSRYICLDTKTIQMSVGTYWGIDLAASPKPLADGEVLENFRTLLTGSVRRRLRSDVPVGSSLSGGLDSSVIVSLASEGLGAEGRRVKTFSARFPGFAKDEGAYMAKVVERTGADPVYVYPSGGDMISKINKLYYYQEEPFGSASILAQYEVMQSAREHGVTVLLDGQGADEILGGYRHYWPSYINGLGFRRLRKSLEATLYYLRGETGSHVNFGLIKDSGRIMSNDFPSLLRQLKNGRMAVRQSIHPVFDSEFYAANRADDHLPGAIYDGRVRDLEHRLYFDTYISGLSELLRYADRNAMAHSREVRLPFLDHELVSFLFRLPVDWKIRGRWTKYLLRKAFEPVLPPEVTWRKDKVGYEPPQADWMTNGQVREGVREARTLLVQKGILHREYLTREVRSGTVQAKVPGGWSILMAAGLFS